MSLKRESFSQFQDRTIDVPEYAFATVEALETLLQAAKDSGGSEIVFVAPDNIDKLNNDEKEEFSEVTEGNAITEQSIFDEILINSMGIHPYWKLRGKVQRDCNINNPNPIPNLNPFHR